jgi:hypothetical protein
MAIGTIPVLLGVGDHASRPAANAVGIGGIYSCTDHNLIYQTDGASWTTWATLGAGAAPTSADYLVGTANGSLSGEIVVGTTPGGELGNTWASPTVDSTHSGSAHTDFIAKAIVDTKGDLIAATAADTVAKLPVIAGNGSSLIVASGESTGLKWQLNKYDATAAPAVTDDDGDGYSVGSVWIDVTGDDAYICVDASTGAAVWVPFDSSSGESWEGVWSAGTYTTGMIVEHDDVIYQANTTTTDEPPSADWDVLYTAPGGGGPLLYVDSLAVGATGDEFADMSAWTATGSVTNTLVTTNVYDATIQRLVFTTVASTDRYTKSAPDTDFTAYLTMYGTDQEDLIGWGYVNTSGTGCGIAWRAGTVWSVAFSGWVFASSPTQVWQDPPDWPIAGSPYMGTAAQFRIARSGSDIIVAVSYDGGSVWLAVHTFTAGSPAGSKLWLLGDFLNPSTYRLNVGRLTVT